MLAIDAPLAQFFDLDGSPLDAGYLYFGTVNNNPETSPVAVYWDEAGTQPAAQPVRTSNGYIVRSGSPAVLYVGGDYSITVRDNKRRLVLYAPSSSAAANDLALQQQIDQLIADLANTSDVSKGDALIGVKQPYTHAAARTQHSKNTELLTLDDWGIVGNGSTDDTAAFVDLESDVLGARINLMGRICLVSAVPDGNDYYNGAFKVGTQLYWRHQNPRSHPFETPSASVRAVDPREGIYRGLNVGLFPIAASSTWVLVWRESLGHSTEDGARLMAADTDDAGNTLTNIRLIFTTSTSDTRNFATGVMGTGRLGIVASRPQAAGTYIDPIFIYSDDNGATWSSAAIPTTDTVDFHSKIYPWPASAGGNDTSGFVVYGYRPTAEGGGITAFTTIDNGATWVERLNVVPVTVAFPSISELSVARIGTQNKWVMVVRTSTGLNMGVATSTNLTTWTGLVDSGLFLSSNPPELIYEDGKLWVLSYSRRGRAILTEYGNAIVIAEANANTVYNSGGASGWGGWKVVSPSTFWPTGYCCVHKVRGRFYALFTGAEETAGSSVGRTAYLCLLSSDTVEAANARQMFGAIAQPNSIYNGGLQLWTAGTSFASFAARNVVADGWTFARSSFTAGATVTRQNGDKAQYCMRVRRDDGDVSTQAMTLCFTLTQQDSIPYRNRAVTISFRARAGAGFSAASGFLTVQMRQTNNAGEQQATTSSGQFPIGDGPVQSSATGVTLDGLWRDYVLTVGNVNADATQLLLRITYTPSGTAANDYYEFERMKVEPGRVATPFIFERLADIVQRAKRFLRIFTVQTENGSRHISFGDGMHGTPTVSLSVGSASNVTPDGFELSHTSAASCTVTARYPF